MMRELVDYVSRFTFHVIRQEPFCDGGENLMGVMAS